MRNLLRPIPTFSGVLLAAALLVWAPGCGGGGGGPATPADPCEGIELPPCPPECTAEQWGKCGQSCRREGTACGNEIGDSMTCTDGVWQCVVHPPLGPGCNLVCRRDPAAP